jgi:hypothetical protein
VLSVFFSLALGRSVLKRSGTGILDRGEKEAEPTVVLNTGPLKPVSHGPVSSPGNRSVLVNSTILVLHVQYSIDANRNYSIFFL